MADTFEFTLDEESEKKLFEIMTDVNTEKTPSFTITDKYGHTAEYMKVVHGKWIHRPGSWFHNDYQRSECGDYLDFNGLNAGRGDANYCPNCGADMRGEQDG